MPPPMAKGSNSSLELPLAGPNSPYLALESPLTPLSGGESERGAGGLRIDGDELEGEDGDEGEDEDGVEPELFKMELDN